MKRTRHKKTQVKPVERTKKPVKWNDDRPRQAYLLAMLFGATDEEIATVMGVDVNTIYYWKRTKPEFLKALDEGKMVPDDEVERSLFRAAIGYSHPAIDIKVHQGKVIKTPFIKHYPPDVTACIFWLKNRRRNKWADVSKKEISVMLMELDLGDFSLEEKLVIEKLGMKQLMEHNPNND